MTLPYLVVNAAAACKSGARLCWVVTDTIDRSGCVLPNSHVYGSDSLWRCCLFEIRAEASFLDNKQPKYSFHK